MLGKFRVWDKQLECMFTVWHDFMMNCEGDLFDKNDRRRETDPDYISVYKDRYIKQFFAALYDKNDKEIYEGDFVFNESKNWISLVKFKSGIFCIWTSVYDSNPLAHSCHGRNGANNIVVIGNIFQTPELLTDPLLDKVPLC